MKKIQISMCLLLFALLNLAGVGSFSAFAGMPQGRITVKGVVQDADGNAVPGAYVVVKE
ncbi:MAG: hypothetical protein HUJ91_01945, partial [Bacteroidales bacterium]|nr:hypothetical protein [Bacteroidales bacterium]